MLVMQVAIELQHEPLAGFGQARVRSDRLFALVRPEFLYERPIPQRHSHLFIHDRLAPSFITEFNDSPNTLMTSLTTLVSGPVNLAAIHWVVPKKSVANLRMSSALDRNSLIFPISSGLHSSCNVGRPTCFPDRSSLRHSCFYSLANISLSIDVSRFNDTKCPTDLPFRDGLSYPAKPRHSRHHLSFSISFYWREQARVDPPTPFLQPLSTNVSPDFQRADSARPAAGGTSRVHSLCGAPRCPRTHSRVFCCRRDNKRSALTSFAATSESWECLFCAFSRLLSSRR